MPNSTCRLSPPWRALTLAAGLALASGPALAQTVDELTVYGRYGSDADASRLSATVSYADLDLTTEPGRAMLRERVRMTARDLCRRLGGTDSAGTPRVGPCEEDAVNSAREQERIAFATAVPRAYAVAPPTEPYAAPVDDRAVDEMAAAPSVESYGQPASVTVETVTNGPVPDTAANRERYGEPMSNGGRRTSPAGN